MRGIINIYTIAILLASSFFTACQKGQHDGGTDGREQKGEVRPADYRFTRAGGAVPDGTAYTFVSYNKNKDNDTYGPNVTTLDGQFPVGQYAYLSNPVYKGILQPCEVDDGNGTNTGIPYHFTARNPQRGQALFDGDFKTVCVYPAMPLTGVSGGKDRVLFARGQECYASDPFQMRVDGYEIFDLDGAGAHSLTELRSKVIVDFVQGSANPFTLKDAKLVNPGKWGWYHPLHQMTSVSYDIDDPANIYDRISNPTEGDEEALGFSNNYPGTPGDLYETGLTGEGAVLYTTGYDEKDGFYFFSHDYQLSSLPQPGLAFSIDMAGGSFKIVVPLNITMERGYCYRFKLTVESVAIRVSFQVADWETGTIINDQIGGGKPEILGVWTVGGWVPGSPGGSGSDIGTPNP